MNAAFVGGHFYQQVLNGVVYHVAPAADVEVLAGLRLWVGVHINLMHIAFVHRKDEIFSAHLALPRKRHRELKIRHIAQERLPLMAVQNAGGVARAEDEMDASVRQLAAPDVLYHAAKRSNAGAGADKDQIAVGELLGEYKIAVGAFESDGFAHLRRFKKISRGRAAFQSGDAKLRHFFFCRRAGQRVAAPALEPLLMDGQIHGNKLPGLEFKRIVHRHLQPKSSHVGRAVFNANDGAVVPFPGHSVAVVALRFGRAPVGSRYEDNTARGLNLFVQNVSMDYVAAAWLVLRVDWLAAM